MIVLILLVNVTDSVKLGSSETNSGVLTVFSFAMHDLFNTLIVNSFSSLLENDFNYDFQCR